MTARPPAGLTVTGLHAAYDRLQVLHGIDLTVAPGEVLALVGANGAGKTSVLRSVSGLLKPAKGTVKLGDTDITSFGAEKIASLGLAHVPENRLVFPTLTVEDNLVLGGYVRRKDGGFAERRAEALALFPRLNDRILLAAGALSGGEQQMLAMARGLAVEPAVLLLDELSMGLAPLVVEELYGIVSQIARTGTSILVVEQFARTVLGVADLAAIMVNGSIRQIGHPNEVERELSAAYLGG